MGARRSEALKLYRVALRYTFCMVIRVHWVGLILIYILDDWGMEGREGKMYTYKRICWIVYCMIIYIGVI